MIFNDIVNKLPNIATLKNTNLLHDKNHIHINDTVHIHVYINTVSNNTFKYFYSFKTNNKLPDLIQIINAYYTQL